MRGVKNGDLLTTKYGTILLVERVEITYLEKYKRHDVKVYFYFELPKDEMGIQPNEWLTGFYGPKWDNDENFYRRSTDEEIELFWNKLKEYGYMWNNELHAPCLTPKEFHRRSCPHSPYLRLSKVLALGFMHFLDENKFEGKMCLSNGECADIERAFKDQDWDKLGRYFDKYIQEPCNNPNNPT